MALNIELTSTSSVLSSYLSNFEASFDYNDNGWFNGVFGGGDQFVAGELGTPVTDPSGEPSAIMDMDDYNYSPGAFDGDVTQIALGSDLYYDVGSDSYVQTEELIITPDSGYMPVTGTFSEAIYSLSHGGQLDGGTFFGQSFAGLTDYFAEQGTNQIGTSGEDELLSFAGDDTLTGNGSTFGDSFSWYADYYDDAGTYGDGWGDDEITDFVDGTDAIYLIGFGWSDYTDFTADGGSLSGNTITYNDSVNGITSTIDVAFSGSGTLDWSDVIFVA